MRQNHHNNKNNKNNNRQRSRGRRQSGGGGNPANKVYDSNGPDVRVRGSAQTVAEKYLQLATDAQSFGDNIKAEGYFQFAEHYLRIVASNNAVRAQKQAEKEKAMAEQNAKREARKAEEAAQLAAQQEAVNEVAPASKDTPQSDADANGEDQSGWEGPQPAFLKSDDDVVVEKKPKRQRRKPVAKKAKASDNEDKSADAPQEVADVDVSQEQDVAAG